MKKLFLTTLILLSPFTLAEIDYAYSFKSLKLKPIDYSKNFNAIIIQENCPTCHQVYKYMDKTKVPPKSVLLTSIYEPSKRWKAKHKKYMDTYNTFATSNIIKEKGVFPKATPGLYTWDAKKQKGKIIYGLAAIYDLFNSKSKNKSVKKEKTKKSK